MNELCPICNEAVESTLNCLTDYKFAKTCFSIIGQMINVAASSVFSEWMETVFDQYKGLDLQRIVTLCWEIWKSRNAVVWNKKGMEADDVMILAKTMLNQLLSACWIF